MIVEHRNNLICLVGELSSLLGLLTGACVTQNPPQPGWPVRKTAFLEFSRDLQVCPGLLPSNYHFFDTLGVRGLVSLVNFCISWALLVVWAALVPRRRNVSFLRKWLYIWARDELSVGSFLACSCLSLAGWIRGLGSCRERRVRDKELSQPDVLEFTAILMEELSGLISTISTCENQGAEGWLWGLWEQGHDFILFLGLASKTFPEEQDKLGRQHLTGCQLGFFLKTTTRSGQYMHCA